ncbi:RNA polymerase sigma factor [Butyricimonas paravirosa]|uniref:RNA polymerase sigma factor n=2 Tax=Odoribacteraceae TaxID=1853231 RepID=UPI000E47AA84|nr:RNA polymerase sigma-70 factor [Butyricimonas paravirosa]MCQ4872991.1 RNA polymerase sigma-70 factor [Butyricimonas paravirosa]RHR78460.1 RNA polymerase sigma-70 factor [Odoribacter sp. AF15-53]
MFLCRINNDILVMLFTAKGDENIIFERMQKGDSDAFEYFFKTYIDSLYAYALGFCQDVEFAEDVVQEVFVRFWTMREKISYSDSIYGYLQRSVRNICINQQVHAKVEEKYRQEILSTEEEVFDWENLDELEELRRQLLEAIDRLPEKCREIFVLSCVEGLKYAEVCDKLGVSINTVKTQVRFAYKKLRDDLNVPVKIIILLIALLH